MTDKTNHENLRYSFESIQVSGYDVSYIFDNNNNVVVCHMNGTNTIKYNEEIGNKIINLLNEKK